jgi:hypothetical protein
VKKIKKEKVKGSIMKKGLREADEEQWRREEKWEEERLMEESRMWEYAG